MNKNITKIAEQILIAQEVKQRGESTFFADFLVLVAASDAYGRWLEETTGKTDVIDSVLARALRIIKMSSDSTTQRITEKFTPVLTSGLRAMFELSMKKPWTYNGIMVRSSVIRTVFRRLAAAKLKPMFDTPREYNMVSKAMEATDLDDEKVGFQAISELPVRTPIFRVAVGRFVKRVSGQTAYVPVAQAIEAANLESSKLVSAQSKKETAPLGSVESKNADMEVKKIENKISESTKNVKGAEESATKADVINIASQVVNSGKKPKAFEDIERITGYAPDKEQEAAILTEGRVLVAASAGSGKTSCVASKVAYLIKDKNVDPNTIFVTTFTGNAADEMKKRIVKLGGDKAEDCTVKTFHAFALEQLIKNASEKYKQAINNSYDHHFQYTFLIKMALEVYEEDLGRKSDTSPLEAQLMISNWKYNQIGPDQIDAYLVQKGKDAGEGNADILDALGGDVATIYKMVETLKGRNKIFNKEPYYNSGTEKWKKTLASVEMRYKQPLVDFDDMLVDFYTYMEKVPKIKEAIQNKYKHFIMDEAQDSNNIQLKLFMMITEKVDGSKGDDAWIVGDPSQAIYNFRGAKPKEFVALSENPKWKLRKIRTNYRCRTEIVDAANKLLSHSKEIIPLDAVSSRGGKAEIDLKIGTPTDIANEVMNSVKQQISIPETDEKPSSYAVITRTNRELHDYEAACIVRGIPYKRKGGKGFFNRIEIKKVLAWITIATSDDIKEQNAAILEIYNYPNWYLGNAFTNELKMDKLKRPYLELLDDNDFLYRLGKSSRGAKDFYSEIMQLRRWVAAEKDNPEKATTTDQLIEEIMNIKGAKGTVKDLVKIDIKDENAEADEKEKESYGSIDFLLKMAEPDPTEIINSANPYEFKDKVEMMKEKAEKLKNEKDGIILSTIHAAKGLQWKNVIAVMSEPRPDSDIEEERRMAYVQMTRAENNLTIVSPTINNAGKKAKMSPFINEAGLDVLNEKEDKVASIKDNPSFSSWFGDSKVVDSEGQPLVVYKGMLKKDWKSGEEIKVFKSTNGPWAGFFTSDKEVANKFKETFSPMGESVVHAVYLKIEKPYVIDAKGGKAKDYMFDNVVFKQKPKNQEAYDAFNINSGYDGVIIKNTSDEGDLYIPKESNQIKTISNKTFDKNNPDITASLKNSNEYFV